MSNFPFQCTVIRSDRKTVAVQIAGPNAVTVRAPRRMPQSEIDRFLTSHLDWIQKHLAMQPAPQPRFTAEEIRALAQQALTDLPARAARFAPMVGVTYGRITIRNQKSKWGSCSSKGNLNFNCLLMLCPEYVRDYVVIHELCHRREMNHSAAFWTQVARVMPDYQRARDWLRREGGALIRRLG